MNCGKKCAGIIGFTFFVCAIISLFKPNSTSLKTQSCKNKTSNYNLSSFEENFIGFSAENIIEINFNRFNFYNKTGIVIYIETM